MKRTIPLTLMVLFLVTVVFAATVTVTIPTKEIAVKADTLKDVTFKLIADQDLAAVDLSATFELGSNLVQFTEDPISLSQDQTKSTTFTVGVPFGTISGSYTGEITATSGNLLSKDAFTIIVPAELSFVDANSNTFATFKQGIEPDNKEVLRKITVKNDGKSEVQNLKMVAVLDGKATDANGVITIPDKQNNDNLQITIKETGTFTLKPTSTLNNDDEKVITIGLKAESGFATEEFTGKLKVIQGPNVLKEIDFIVLVQEGVCEFGQVGSDLDIIIDEPDSGDKFNSEKEISVIVEVRNDGNTDMDVDVFVYLINTDTGKIEDDDNTKGKRVDENDKRKFTFNLKIPSNADDEDKFEIFVKAFKENDEDAQCVEKSTDIEADVNEEILVTILNIPPQTICGSPLQVSMEATNNLNEDADNTRLKLRIPTLGIEQVTEQFDLDEDDDVTRTLSLPLPSTMKSGDYLVEAIATYTGNSFSDSRTIAITCQEEEKKEEELPVIKTITPEQIQDLFKKQQEQQQTFTGSQNDGTALEEKGIFDTFNTVDKIPTLAWVILDLVLVAVIVLLAIAAMRRR